MAHRLLVTGGAGFIGKNFIIYWAENYPDDALIVLDKLTYAGDLGGLDALIQRRALTFVKADICDTDVVMGLMHQNDIDTVVHFAAESHVDRSIDSPDEFVKTNVVGTHSLLKAARRAWSDGGENRRFHHVSTDEVYGSLGMEDPAFTEESKFLPNSPYAASKAAADHLVRAYHHTYGLPTIITNCSNNYGPFQHPEKLIPLIIVNVLNGMPVPIYGDGANVRDWLYVTDHCAGISRALRLGISGQTYNIGGNNEQSNLTIATICCNEIDRTFLENSDLAIRFQNAPAAIGKKSSGLIRFVSDRPGHDRRYAINAAKIMTELDYQSVETMTTGIRRTVKWYLENENWWRERMTGAQVDWNKRNSVER